MRILIDADGCPVTKEAIKIGKEYGVESVVFCDTSHEFNIEGVKVIAVGKGNDSADFALVNEAKENDIVISQDYGLSAMALAKGAIIINQNGLIINDFNIDTLLTSRHLAKKARRAGKHLKGPSKRTIEQDEKFEKTLRGILNEHINRT
ncbi:MAG: DUF188 domain-containing protein [Eubacteriales bacterium]|nr:DUF188 domain-containing protein [Eubacteriales bacterium]